MFHAEQCVAVIRQAPVRAAPPGPGAIQGCGALLQPAAGHRNFFLQGLDLAAIRRDTALAGCQFLAMAVSLRSQPVAFSPHRRDFLFELAPPVEQAPGFEIAGSGRPQHRILRGQIAGQDCGGHISHLQPGFAAIRAAADRSFSFHAHCIRGRAGAQP
ncbi:MAG: hypothetical protein AMXMBFR8_09090 [Nevskiales bacterium]